MAKRRINNLVVVSDLHCGCRMGLLPPEGLVIDGGTKIAQSKLQKKVWSWWDEFWGEWVPVACHNEPYAVVVNGDALDGVHHNSTSQISHNLADQSKIAYAVLKPIYERCEGRLYMVRGTEAHVGPSGAQEEQLATVLEAIPDEEGMRSRYELWVEIGRGLVHCMHHIGTTGTSHYESTAVLKELSESYQEAGRWRRRSPDCVVRSHRHRNIEIRVPTDLGYGIAFVTPGWQLKTPFAYKIPGGRISTPQIGGSVIRQGDHDMYTRHRVWGVSRPKTVVL